MKFKKSAEITNPVNSEPISFMIFIQQEQTIKHIVFLYTTEPSTATFQHGKCFTDVDRGLLVIPFNSGRTNV